MRKNILQLLMGLSSYPFFVRADVGLLPNASDTNPTSTDRIQCIHFSDDLWLSSQSDGIAVTDRFQVILPSAHNGTRLRQESVRFTTKVKVFGPSGYIHIPVEGSFLVKARHGNAIDITAAIKIYNPYTKTTDVLVEKNPAIYQESINYLKNRSRDLSKSSFRFDYDPSTDQRGGGFFCAPILSHNGPKNPDNVRLIQGRW
jgi:hypothetical protein